MKVKSLLKILSLITLSTIGIQQVITSVNHSTQLNANNLKADNNIPSFKKVDSAVLGSLNIKCRVTLTIANDPQIWVGTSAGVFVSKDSGTSFALVNTIPNNATINSIFMDSQDTIWAGGVLAGSTAGVVFSSKDHGATFTKVSSPALTGVLAINFIFQDKQLNIWIGGNSGGTSSVIVSKDKGATFTASLLPATLSANCIFQSANGWLWIGGVSSTGSNLYVSKDAGSSFTAIAGLTFQDWQVNSITQDSNGNYYVSGSYQKGVFESYLYKSTDGATFTEIKNFGYENINIFSIFADNHNWLWMGTNAGLAVSKDGGTSFTQVSTIPSDVTINSVSQDQSNVYWIASSEGLYNNAVAPAVQSSSNLAVIIGASVGGVALLAIIIGGVVLYRKKHLAKKPAEGTSASSAPSNNA